MDKKRHVYVDKSEIKPPSVLFLDQANTAGYSVWNGETLVESGILARGKENIQEYAEGLVGLIKELIVEYSVNTLFHEEVFIPRDGNPGNIAGVERLYYIKHKITDIGFKSSLEVLGLDNGSWKKQLADGKFTKTKDDKEEVKRLVTEMYPNLEFFTGDEIDAIGMGIAVMVKNDGRFYDVSRYNKKLPIHIGLAPLNWDVLTGTYKIPAKFKHAIEAGGLYEIPLNKAKDASDEFCKLLTHKDLLAYTIIPKSYKYWGVNLLLFNKKPDDFKVPLTIDYLTKDGSYLKDYEEGSYILYAARKSRL